MRKTGHKVDATSLRSALDDYAAELAKTPARRADQIRKQNPAFFTGNAEMALAVARLEYLFGEPIDALKQKLGAVLAEVPVAVDMGGLVLPGIATAFLGSALVLGDDKLAAWLSGIDESVYNDPDGEMSPGASHYLKAYQAAASGDPKALDAAVRKFRSVLVPEKLLEPRAEMALYKPLADLLEALAKRDQTAFDAAWKAEGDAWKKRYARASEVANFDGLLDLESLGLAVLARRAGLQVSDTNPYAPLELLDSGSKKK